VLHTGFIIVFPIDRKGTLFIRSRMACSAASRVRSIDLNPRQSALQLDKKFLHSSRLRSIASIASLFQKRDAGIGQSFFYLVAICFASGPIDRGKPLRTEFMQCRYTRGLRRLRERTPAPRSFSPRNSTPAAS
jgi:hypothetical protein